MKYANGKNILPQELLDKVQHYIEGELLYIPKKNKEKAGWGEKNGTREFLFHRNLGIFMLYKKGITIEELAKKNHLSKESIRKIVYSFVGKERRNRSK